MHVQSGCEISPLAKKMRRYLGWERGDMSLLVIDESHYSAPTARPLTWHEEPPRRPSATLGG